MFKVTVPLALAFLFQVASLHGEQTDDATKAPRGKLTQVFSGEKDACSRKNVVSVPGRDGRVEIRAGETKWVVFETLKSTFYWRCGDTEEKFEYKDVQPFNCVKVERSADTGRISWTCYVLDESKS